VSSNHYQEGSRQEHGGDRHVARSLDGRLALAAAFNLIFVGNHPVRR
jgi:hypothetical protein